MALRSDNRKLAVKLLLFSAGMFAFGVFAMPPLYAKFCEITGFGQAGIRISSANTPLPGNGSMMARRTVKLMFDANANSAIPWEFEPKNRSMEVTLGEPSESSYLVNSLANYTTAGRAVYNVTPPEAAQHFVKTDCVCFSRQTLDAGERREMPVRFFVEPGLPPEVTELTLSYTFFLSQDNREEAP